jgi:hypothetical protein
VNAYNVPHVIVEHNAALGETRILPTRYPTYEAAVAACERRMPDPRSYRRFYSLTVRVAPGYGNDLYGRRGEA